MNRTVSLIGLAAISASLGMMAACSSSSSSDDSAAGGDSGTTDSSTTHDTGVVDTGTVDSGGGNPDDTCTSMATKAACGQCCLTNHSSGAGTFTTATIACACHDTGVDGGTDGGAGPCAEQCAATICAATPANPDNTCQTCLEAQISTAGGACADYVATQCQAVTDCVAEQTCLTGCPAN
jgi:hypothetical protein